MNDGDREHFSDVVENSFAISSRHQFFAWTQSSLQSLLPHEILICGIEDGSRQGMSMHRFSASRYFRDEHFDVVADSLNGLKARLMAVAEGSRQVIIFCPIEGGRTSDAELATLVRDNELKNLAAHLVTGASGKVEALYGFGRIPVALDARLGHIVELLIPHIHNAFLRVLATEREITSAGSQPADGWSRRDRSRSSARSRKARPTSRSRSCSNAARGRSRTISRPSCDGSIRTRERMRSRGP